MYNILCDSLGIDPLPNNGTLRLPFKPAGLHSDENAPAVEQPADPPAKVSTTAGPAPTPQPTLVSDPDAAESPPATDPGSDDEKGPTWWGTLLGKVEKLKDWAGNLFSSAGDAISGKGKDSSA